MVNGVRKKMAGILLLLQPFMFLMSRRGFHLSQGADGEWARFIHMASTSSLSYLGGKIWHRKRVQAADSQRSMEAG